MRTPLVAVIGAGAAGIMAAIHAAAGGARVVLLERTRDGGRKILISGGGRCNILPSRMEPAQYVTASSPNTLRKLLLSWPLAEQQAWFESIGIPLALEAETGKLFPQSNRARDVRDRLLAEAERNGAMLRFDARVRDITPGSDGGWDVVLDDDEIVHATRVVVATGGLSVPATGSDGAGLRILQRLGHELSPTYPALTPLTAQPNPHEHLAGVSLTVTLSAQTERTRASTTGGFLFTHRGYSGPAVLDISHHAVQARLAQRQQDIRVQWSCDPADVWDARLRAGGAATVATILRRALPTRLADTLLAEADVDGARSLAELRRDERQRLVEQLANYRLPWNGDEGYKKAEVTGGGIALGEINPRTMESKRAPGIFLCGEVLDAFGPIGGYNFLWAWATGRAAGRGVVGEGTG